MSGNDTQSRRTVLKASLATVAGGLFGTGVAAAAGGDDPVSAEAAGIRDDVERLRREGDTLGALELLDRHDVDYTATYNSLGGRERDDAITALSNAPDPSSGDVSTQDFFSESDSNTTVWAYNLYDDIYLAQNDFTVKAFDDALDPDMPGTNDLLSLAYSQPNEAVGGYLDYGMFDFDDDIMSVEETPVVDGPGAVVSINDGGTVTSQSYYQGFVSFRVDKDSSDEETVGGKYAHTWSAGNIGSWPSVSYSWNGMGISVDPGYLNDKWELTSTDRF